MKGLYLTLGVDHKFCRSYARCNCDDALITIGVFFSFPKSLIYFLTSQL